MRWKNLRISYKFLIGFLVIFVLFSLILSINIYYTLKIHQEFDYLIKKSFPATTSLLEIEIQLTQLTHNLHLLKEKPNFKERNTIIKNIKQDLLFLEEKLIQYKKTEEEEEEEIISFLEKKIGLFKEKIRTFLLDPFKEELHLEIEGIKEEIALAIEKELINDKHQLEIKISLFDFLLKRTFIFIVSIWGLIFFLILFFFFSFYLQLKKDFDLIYSKLKLIGEGKLKTRIHLEKKDEIGKISQEIDLMTERLEKQQRELKYLTANLEKRVRKRTKELETSLKELEKFQRLTVGRELKMIELKKEIEELRKKSKGFKK